MTSSGSRKPPLNGDVILCKDLRIAENELEAQVVYMSSAQVFALANRRIPAPLMIQTYLEAEPSIVSTVQHAEGPYVMALSLGHKLRPPRLPLTELTDPDDPPI